MKHFQTLDKYCIQSRITKKLFSFFLQILFIILMGATARAQDLHYLDPKSHHKEELPFLQETLPSDKPYGLILPAQPSFQKKSGQKPIQKMVILNIEVKGSTVFSDQELSQITAPYLNQVLTNEVLEEIRHRLTLYYINKGYVNSGATIPDQTVANGRIIFKIIEGSITHMDVKGNKRFSKGYLEDRLYLDAGPPLNIEALQKRLQQLQQDQRIAHIQAELKPGVNPGESLLDVGVEEENPFRIQLGFDNYQSPTIGAERGLGNIMHQNLTGHGDILNLYTVMSEDNDPQIDIWYSLPFTAYDTSLILGYSKSNLYTIEDPFEDLDIESESEMFQVSVRHPFYRTLSQEFAMAFALEHNKNKTFLLGQPFSFSSGAIDGESENTVLRFSQEWTLRTKREVFSARSQFSLGINEMDATIHSTDIPDGRFFSWLGQIQWARIFDFLDTQLIFRTDLQLSTDPLLGVEQIAVGGRYSVRGYRENQLVRDQALITSIEARVPLVRDKGWTEYLQAAVFFDFGEAWNKSRETPSPRSISSVGLGLRWAGFVMKTPFKIRPKFEIYWGLPLRDVDTPGGDLQDDGIHFQLVIQNFY